MRKHTTVVRRTVPWLLVVGYLLFLLAFILDPRWTEPFFGALRTAGLITLYICPVLGFVSAVGAIYIRKYIWIIPAAGLIFAFPLFWMIGNLLHI